MLDISGAKYSLITKRIICVADTHTRNGKRDISVYHNTLSATVLTLGYPQQKLLVVRHFSMNG